MGALLGCEACVVGRKSRYEGNRESLVSGRMVGTGTEGLRWYLLCDVSLDLLEGIGTGLEVAPGFCCGGADGVHGSGTHGLHTLTVSAPPINGWPSCKPGGCTMYSLGMVIRCGEQLAHTTLPHFLQ